MTKNLIHLIIIILFTLFLNACDNTLPAGSTINSSFTDYQDSYCMIDLRGEVMYPGIYKVKNGTLLNEVITLAGGVTNNADLATINLVSIVTTNTKVTIPSKNNNIIINDSKININTCTKEELLVIPKIGDSKASAIIEYRTINGLFTSIEDIKKVSGIGEGLFEEIKIYITI